MKRARAEFNAREREEIARCFTFPGAGGKRAQRVIAELERLRAMAHAEEKKLRDLRQKPLGVHRSQPERPALRLPRGRQPIIAENNLLGLAQLYFAVTGQVPRLSRYKKKVRPRSERASWKYSGRPAQHAASDRLHPFYRLAQIYTGLGDVDRLIARALKHRDLLQPAAVWSPRTSALGLDASLLDLKR